MIPHAAPPALARCPCATTTGVAPRPARPLAGRISQMRVNTSAGRNCPM